MSTTFAVQTIGNTTEVAHRWSLGGKDHLVGIKWLSKKKYPNDTKVIALDNSPQGVETIGDLKTLDKNGKL